MGFGDFLQDRLTPDSLTETMATKGYTYFDHAFGDEISNAFQQEIMELYEQVFLNSDATCAEALNATAN